jgi:uncharacterized PurR-regulated membrane protein YhhQ (DUF165 family)
MIIIAYLTAIVLANLSTTYFGAWATIINAFLFIGLNITSRDKLHEKWKNNNLLAKMGMLIFVGSFISYLLNKDSARIAIASFIAFVITGVIDTVVYQLAINKTKFIKINLSNVFSSLADSIAFPTIAFGSFMPLIIMGQFLAKVFGGFVWSIILKDKKL